MLDIRLFCRKLVSFCMGFQKGHERFGGKKKGDCNKVTAEARIIFKDIMEGEIENVKAALDEVRKKSAYNYIMCFTKLAPYFMPKQLDIKSDGVKLEPPVIQLIQINEAES